MTKPRSAKGMHGEKDRKTRGRSSISSPDPFQPSDVKVPQVLRREAKRPINAGGGRQRGDRRDTSRTYTGNQKHKARGSNPRPDVKTRKR